MKWLKRISLVLVLLLLSILCFAKGKAELDTGAAELKFYSWVKAGVAYEKNMAFIEWFEKQYPQIKINYENPQGSIHQAIFTDFAAGTPPDIWEQGGNELEQYQDLGIVANLTPFIKKDPDFNERDLLKVPYNYFRLYMDPKEDVYALSTGWTIYLLFFNKKLFEEAGLEMPDSLYKKGKWNKDAFLNAVRAIAKDKDGDGKNDQFGWEVPGWYTNMYYWMGVNGLDSIVDVENNKLLYNDPAAREAYQMVHDLAYKENVIPGHGDIDAYEAFPQGIVGMQVTGNWAVGRLNALEKDWDYGITMVPKFKRYYTNLYSNGIAMSSETKYPDQAWIFIREFAIGEGAKLTAERNISFPMVKDIFEGMETDPIWVESLKFAVPVPRHKKMGSLRQPISKHHSAYMQDPNGDLEEMIKNIIKDGEEVLQED